MTARSRRTWAACGAAGLAAAIIDMVFVLPIQYAQGVSPVVVLQTITGGFLGPVTYHYGAKSFAGGGLIHLALSLVAATLYIQASRVLPILVTRPVVCGLAFGAVVYAVMTFAVVPLSAIGSAALPASVPLMLTSLAVHMFAFGLPIAVVGWAMLQAGD